MTDKKLYSVNEFLSRNSIGRTLFYALVKSGQIDIVKVGTKTLVSDTSEKSWHSTLARKVSAYPTTGPTRLSGIGENSPERPRTRKPQLGG